MRVALLVFLLSLPASGAAAMEPDGSILLPVQKVGGGLPETGRMEALIAGPAWREFQRAHGPWSVLPNAATGTPQRAFGPAIALTASPAAGVGDIAAAADAFVAGYAGVLGVDPSHLRRIRAVRAGDVWYVSYRQTHGGVDVLLSEVELRISTRGSLMAFGSVYYPALRVSTRPTLTADRAARHALDGLTDASSRASGRLFVLPVSDGERTTDHLVYEVFVERESPPGNFIACVDAHSGTVLWRHNRVRNAELRGRARGDVQLVLPTDPFEVRPFAAQYVSIGQTTVVTDTAGTFTADLAAPASLEARLAGPAVDVQRIDGPDAFLSFPVAPGDSATLHWTDANSHPAERDAFYHTNLIHRFITQLDPAFTSITYSMPCAVNIAQTCNAYWDGTGINFFVAGNGCPNTAQMPDVVYHEYGHGINDRLYQQLGSPFGMINGAVHEGLADVAAAVITDDPRVGLGFFGPGTMLRTIQNTNRYPANVSSDPHVTGLILAGAFWDLRLSVSQEVFRRLSHFAKYGLPDDPSDGIAFAEWFVETLVADDDDGNLANGTPHSAAIIQAFNAHGIGSELFFSRSFAHTPIPSTLDTTSVHAALWMLGGLPGVDPDSVSLVYSTDGFTTSTEVPATRLSASEYRAEIPAQSGGTVVKYYIRALDPVGGTPHSFPAGAPSSSYRFLVGRRPAQAGVVYATSGGSPVLHALNRQTGAASVLGPLGVTLVHNLSIHPETHELYALSGSPTSSTLYRVSPAQGESFEAASIPIPNLRAFALAGGDTVYAVDGGGRLYRVLTGVMETLLVGTATGVTYASLARNPLDGTLWAGVAPIRGPKDAIYRVDPATGAAALAGLTGDGRQTWGLAFAPEGVLLGLKGQGTQVNTLIMIGSDSAHGTLIGSTGVTGLTAIAVRGDSAAITGVPGEPSGVPSSFGLTRNYPNPFNPSSRLGVLVALTAEVRVAVYDVLGREVALLFNGTMQAGSHTLVFDAAGLASGVYFARMTAVPVAGGETVGAVQRMMLLR